MAPIPARALWTSSFSYKACPDQQWRHWSRSTVKSQRLAQDPSLRAMVHLMLSRLSKEREMGPSPSSQLPFWALQGQPSLSKFPSVFMGLILTTTCSMALSPTNLRRKGGKTEILLCTYPTRLNVIFHLWTGHSPLHESSATNWSSWKGGESKWPPVKISVGKSSMNSWLNIPIANIKPIPCPFLSRKLRYLRRIWVRKLTPTLGKTLYNSHCKTWDFFGE